MREKGQKFSFIHNFDIFIRYPRGDGKEATG